MQVRYSYSDPCFDVLAGHDSSFFLVDLGKAIGVRYGSQSLYPVLLDDVEGSPGFMEATPNYLFWSLEHGGASIFLIGLAS